MYIGSAIFLMALGAVLRWAVKWQVDGFDIRMAGLIIFLIGILGLVITLVLWYTRRRRTPGVTQVDQVVTSEQYRPDDSAPRL
jgi:membrane protein DedA with SNARE-associated domain